ncbi:kinase-like domain-containing protein, partial [Phyllosticta citrichinensis]
MAPQLANRSSLKWDRLSLSRLGGWLKKDETALPLEPSEKLDQYDDDDDDDDEKYGDQKRPSRTTVPFKVQKDQRIANELSHAERRAFSADRRSTGTSHRNSSPPPKFALRCSAPDSLSPYASETNDSLAPTGRGPPGDSMDDDAAPHMDDGAPLHPRPPLSTTGDMSDDDGSCDGVDERVIKHELDTKWILNLSMHFRDNSDRQKFFMTYAEEPNRWRRLTITVDYRNTDPDSLEATLNSLHYQRDKSERIYEAIRDSLAEVQFFDTVTNLRLETTNGQLHVHVTEDVNETIPYPPVSSVTHLDCRFYRDCDVHFESHLSGFVYKVSVSSRVYIKKEIPGPGSVDEFLYEANALCQLKGSQSVIDFAGLITDDAGERVTGLLISYADKGALVDLIYDGKATPEMSWPRRERWAKQIVRGLSEIHESGYVQGDFTVSNVVVDANDDAKIIDINRRGCPVGWEPPELATLIESGQRIGIYIGIKSDLFQLGMVLWALAEQQDEPEREERPLALPMPSCPPQYYQEVVKACLSDDPRDRVPAKELLLRFPDIHPLASRPPTAARHSYTTHRSDKEYIDPLTAVGHEDIAQYRRCQESDRRAHPASSANLSYADVRPPTEYEAASSGSYIVADAGLCGITDRSPFNYSPFTRPSSSLSLDGDSEHDRHDPSTSADAPDRHERAWERIYEDGNTRLVNNGALRLDHRGNAVEQETVCLSTTPRHE